MVEEGIVFGHKVSKKGTEVDQAKVSVIEKLPSPNLVMGVHAFLGHTDFYRRFTKDFSQIRKPLTNILQKDADSEFNKSCIKAFKTLKKSLTSALIVQDHD